MNTTAPETPRPVCGPGHWASAGCPDLPGHRLVIVIPVYNHAAALRDVARDALDVHDAVMVVDDGSTDDAMGVLQGLKVHLLRHPRNQGKGAAILTAAREARRLGMTHMATIDADGQHDPKDIKRFFPLIQAHPDAVVVGKRDFGHADVPRANWFGREVSNFWLRVQTGMALGDAQSGFRVYPIRIFEDLELKERRYAFEIEVLVKAAWAGIQLMETDISVYYPKGRERISHFHLLWDNLRLTRLNARLTLRAMVPWPHRKPLKDADKQALRQHP